MLTTVLAKDFRKIAVQNIPKPLDPELTALDLADGK